MKYNNRGFSSILILVIVVVLGIIAYSIFKKTSLAPGEESIPENIPEISSEQATPQYKTTQTKTQTITNSSTATITQEDLENLESEAGSMESEIEDLQFEDLGFE